MILGRLQNAGHCYSAFSHGLQEKRLGNELDAFLANRFGKRMVPAIKAIHETEEGRPIKTLWDATVAPTAHARQLSNNDTRIEIERAAGELLKLAS